MDDRPRYMISSPPSSSACTRRRCASTSRRARPAEAHAGNTRLYSEADLERLRLIQRLTTELGLNLAGVEQVMRLEDELRACAGARRLEREMREAIAAVHRNYRRDLVRLADRGRRTERSLDGLRTS
jgi:MerR family transcriptional regulator/heat shock protein HspR